MRITAGVTPVPRAVPVEWPACRTSRLLPPTPRKVPSQGTRGSPMHPRPARACRRVRRVEHPAAPRRLPLGRWRRLTAVEARPPGKLVTGASASTTCRGAAARNSRRGTLPYLARARPGYLEETSRTGSLCSPAHRLEGGEGGRSGGPRRPPEVLDAAHGAGERTREAELNARRSSTASARTRAAPRSRRRTPSRRRRRPATSMRAVTGRQHARATAPFRESAA